MEISGSSLGGIYLCPPKTVCMRVGGNCNALTRHVNEASLHPSCCPSPTPNTPYSSIRQTRCKRWHSDLQTTSPTGIIHKLSNQISIKSQLREQARGGGIVVCGRMPPPHLKYHCLMSHLRNKDVAESRQTLKLSFRHAGQQEALTRNQNLETGGGKGNSMKSKAIQ